MVVGFGYNKRIIMIILPVIIFGIVILSPLINTAFGASNTCTDGDSDTLFNNVDVIASIAGTTPSNSVGKASATGKGGIGCTDPFEADFSWYFTSQYGQSYSGSIPLPYGESYPATASWSSGETGSWVASSGSICAAHASAIAYLYGACGS
ncbi:MAG: hypothetical protein F7B59_02860 [Desulfurococcales archaeon]|nr:hypothetical protein [Desulfurococcales archaeon]